MQAAIRRAMRKLGGALPGCLKSATQRIVRGVNIHLPLYHAQSAEQFSPVGCV